MNRAEIQALIDAAPDGRIGINQAGCPKVTIPYGMHVLDGPIVLTKRVHVDFSGGVLILPNGVAGLDIIAPAWNSIVENLNVHGQGINGAAHGTYGVRAGCFRAQLFKVQVRFCGFGFIWDGRSGEADDSGDSWYDNANAVFASSCLADNCDVGAWLKGGDSNGGYLASLVVNACRVGVADDSFLGNTFAGLHMHTIAEEGYKATAVANYSTVVGSYMELDVAGGLVSQPRITWVGGGAVPHVNVGDRVGLRMCRLGFSDKAPNGDTITATIPHAAVYAGVTTQRLDEYGALINGADFPRWVDNLSQCGLVWYGGTIANDGLTRPIGWTTVDGVSRFDAQHFSIGNALGFEHE